MRPTISARTVVAGVAGSPVAHSLSPLIHNAWLAGAGLDAVYVGFSPPVGAFTAFANGLRGGVVRGLNITAPFKEAALAVADRASPRARQAGAANLLLFAGDGTIDADNTDGEGLLAAFRRQAPKFDPTAGPIVLLGAGGAARGAAAAFLAAGAPGVRVVNRTLARAEALCAVLGGAARSFPVERLDEALSGARALVNATSPGTNGGGEPEAPMAVLAPGAVVMDMVYRPLRTELLRRAEGLGLTTVDGLAMLIGQAEPSFEALFGRPPPPVDVRSLAIACLEGEA